MHLEYFITQLSNHAKTIQDLVQGISDQQARWKPTPDDWSILEVINHLYDEEREDFRAHLDDLLHHPERPWSSIDPQGWVTQRAYNQRDPAISTANFLAERQKSLEWLKSLSAPDWGTARQAPFGALHAGDVLVAWAAHDLLHTRQLVELHWAYLVQQAQPYQVTYAGEW